MQAKDIHHILLAAFLLFFYLPATNAQQSESKNKYSISGTIYEDLGNGKKAPLPYATVTINKYGIGTVTNDNGFYKINNIPAGDIDLNVNYLGKIPVDTLIKLTSNLVLNFVLKEENFKLKEVTVTAESSKAGQSTASKISTTAMEHLQAVSLSDILALLPGGIAQNPTLNTASQINIRNINKDINNINALGAAIIEDGSPISNNANLQTMHPAVIGATAALGGTSSPSGGIDVRNISTENIESVEIIRGIPSAEYGDLTSGAILITSKAGKQPLQIKAKTNPNVYQFSAQKGMDLGGKKGALNISADYAYNVSEPKASYHHYQRAAAKVLHSNSFFDNKWRNNVSITLTYGKDQREKNPDDQVRQIASEGQDLRVGLNANGTVFLNKGWLKNIKYVLSGSYDNKNSHYEEYYTSATAPYSMTTVDGAIITNKPGLRLYDVEGNEITNLSGVDPSHYAQYLPASYLGKSDIDGKEISIYSKATATLFKHIGPTDNRILIGADFKSDGNVGEGKTFSPTAPPYRNLQALNATFRPRPYKDIPFINMFSLFVDENFSVNIRDNNMLRIQAGVRYDMMSESKNFLSPRLNASFEAIPQKLFFRGGYGITAKMPTLLYLYPENAYFEYININEMADTKIPENDRIIMTTTRVYNTENPSLKVSSNEKSEIGFDLYLEKANLNVTAFKEYLQNGYSMTPTFAPVLFKEYKRAGDGSQPVYELVANNPVLAKYYVPGNGLEATTKGIEFDLNIKRIEAIRTSFSLNGAWMHSKNLNNDYTYFDGFSGIGGADRTHVGVYEKGMKKHNVEQITTALRVIHNIPEIGFVISFTAETVWKEKDWYNFGNDSIPIAYISKYDGKKYDFDPSQMNDPEFQKILRQVEKQLYIAESYPPLFNFNINLTKEISDFMRASFFANNMFRSYPVVELKRSPGSFAKRNKNFFFGLELSLLIK